MASDVCNNYLVHNQINQTFVSRDVDDLTLTTLMGTHIKLYHARIWLTDLGYTLFVVTI